MADDSKTSRLGSFNKDTPDLSELQVEDIPTPHFAYCSSIQCGATHHGKQVVKLHAKRNAFACPDCGFALHWRKPRARDTKH